MSNPSSIFPEWLVGNSEARYYSGSSCSDLSSFRQPTEDELKEFYRHQAEGARAMTDDETEKCHIANVVCNDFSFCGDCDDIGEEMKDNDEVVSVDLLSTDTVQTVRDKTQAAIDLRKSTISKLFNKLCAILNAAYKWLFGLLTVKK